MDENAAEAHRSDIRNLKIDKLNQRVTFVTILIPCLLCVMLLFGYFDIKKRVVTVKSTGSTEMDNLAKSLETRLSSLTLSFAKLEYAVKENAAALQEEAAARKRKEEAAEAALEQVQAAKADAKALDRAISGMEKKHAKAAARLAKVAKGMAGMEGAFGREVAELTSRMDRSTLELESLNKSIAAAAALAVSRKEVDGAVKPLGAALEKQKRAHSAELKRLTEVLKAQQRSLDQVRDGLTEMERNAIQIRKELLRLTTRGKRPPAASSPAQARRPAAPAAAPKAAKNGPAAPLPEKRIGPNGIIEENLTE